MRGGLSMAKKQKKGNERFVIPANMKKRIVVHDDKSKFFNKDMRSTLFFMFWIVGFFALLLWYGMF
jgi:hypothetical protein